VTAFGIVWSILTTFPSFQAPLSRLGSVTLVQWSIGNPLETVRLTTIFLIGTCFYLFRDEIGPHLSAKAAIAGGVAAAALMYRDPHFAELAMVTFGAVTLFWMAFRMRLGRLQRVNDSWDISYGVYLYGWPIATYIRWIEPSISPWVLAAVTLPLAFLCGAASWWGLERWAKDWGRGRRNTRQEVEKLAQ
jgi:peptidoglycan/LPS O-acetylase OafA/YrhL